jgi:hypothetical protein
MKKITAISMVILLIATMLHISVSVHYCGGKEVASKISLTAMPANCGMESPEKDLPLTGNTYSNHCCKDVLTICVTDNNYTPSSSFIPPSLKYNFPIFSNSAVCTVNIPPLLISQSTNGSPPGALMSTEVDLAGICVFRI